MKVGKKSPMTLAHFGFGPNDSVLDDAALPVTLTADWCKQTGSAAKPFPSFARLVARRGTPDAESDFSWTLDFGMRRAKAREDMAPHLAEVEKRMVESVSRKDRLVALKKSNSRRRSSRLPRATGFRRKGRARCTVRS